MEAALEVKRPIWYKMSLKSHNELKVMMRKPFTENGSDIPPILKSSVDDRENNEGHFHQWVKKYDEETQTEITYALVETKVGLMVYILPEDLQFMYTPEIILET